MDRYSREENKYVKINSLMNRVYLIYDKGHLKFSGNTYINFLIIYKNREPYTFINISDMAKLVWANPAYNRAIINKARLANEYGRIPPYLDDVYVPIQEVNDILKKWCHKATDARELLEESDVEKLKDYILEIVENNIKKARLLEESEKRKKDLIMNLWKHK